MKLLIVEDERMTREGLLGSLDWESIGVSEVFSAQNGETGLSMAKRMAPDIVLTDIRMPRMDGITMAGHIRKILPDCRIIFLSAYAEIDYYKAAIGLKAIHYMDKPVEASRLKAVMLEAVAECAQSRRLKSGQDLRQLHERRKLADAVCAAEDGESLENAYKKFTPPLDFRSKDWCAAIVVSLRPDYENEGQDGLPLLAAVLSEAADCPNLYTLRRENRIVLLLFMPSEPHESQLEGVCGKLKGKLLGYAYSIAVGKAFRGIKNAVKSYLSAKTVLDKAYLYPWGEVLLYGGETGSPVSVSAYDEEKSGVRLSMTELDEAKTLDACEKLRDKLKYRRDLPYGKAREIYFELISEVFRQAGYMRLRINEDEAEDMISWVVRIESYNLDELHDFLCRQTGLLFQAVENAKNEKKQILAIKDYIAKNYTNDSFSIGDISAFLHLSASHVCTLFKQETGDTINNYLTEYRLGKAKQYLKESLFTAAEISAKVGYRDSSYFGRIFRKRFGMTPNEYRNR